jgi:hypothetical protein
VINHTLGSAGDEAGVLEELETDSEFMTFNSSCETPKSQPKRVSTAKAKRKRKEEWQLKG